MSQPFNTNDIMEIVRTLCLSMIILSIIGATFYYWPMAVNGSVFVQNK